MALSVQNKVSLREFTTLQVGGVASQYIVIDSEKLLNDAVSYAKKHNIPLQVLGGGSNVLIAQEGIDALVLHMQNKGIEIKISNTSEVYLTAAAGEVLDDVVLYAVTQGYWGLENLSHIPGTVGASPIQNVGAYGVEVKDNIALVRVYNTDAQKFEILTQEECQFGYRDSIFKQKEGKKYIVVAVTFKLTTEVSPCLTYKDLQTRFNLETPSVNEVRRAIIEIRSKKFPDWTKVGTAGSFFKNPIISKEKFEELITIYPNLPGFSVDTNLVKIPLGWVLDKILNLKGVGTEKVGTYQGQALVVINRGGATSEDIKKFADEVIQQVYDAIGVEVEWEVTKIGF